MSLHETSQSIKKTWAEMDRQMLQYLPVNTAPHLVTVQQPKQQLPGDNADHSLGYGCCTSVCI